MGRKVDFDMKWILVLRRRDDGCIETIKYGTNHYPETVVRGDFNIKFSFYEEDDEFYNELEKLHQEFIEALKIL